MFKRIWNRLLVKLSAPKQYSNLTDYWRDRARRYGKHSVLNMAHNEKDFEKITAYQKQILFPLLKSQLSGIENTVLDFGCGPGRFTGGLAELISGSAIGVDVTQELLELAPKAPLVSYQGIDGSGYLPFPDRSFDVVWSCLVLGGIPDDKIKSIITEIDRVLRPGGLFFYIENTANTANSYYWFYRNESSYINMARFCNPKKIGDYEDVGQKITIFSGKKPIMA
jgi:SAM-dependent methyltransferase